MTRVLHLIDTGDRGGAETVFVQLVTGLDQNRFHSIAALPRLDGWLGNALRARGVEPVALPTSGRFDFSLVSKVLRLIRMHEIDVLQTHLLTSAVYGAIAGRLAGIPVISTFHGRVDVASPFIWWKGQVISFGARRVVFVSDFLRRELLVLTPIRSRISTVIHNGVDTSRFHPGDGSVWRRRFGISQDIPLIGALGRLVAVKGFDVLIKAAARLRSLGVRSHVVIIGGADVEEHEYSRLTSLCRALGVGDMVSMVGFQEDVPAALRALDVLAVPSRSEGFSLAAVEAMASGAAVVATRSGGPEEIITHGENGLLVPIDDVEALTGALADLVTRPMHRIDLAAAGLASAQTKFSLAQTLRRYESLYTDAISDRNRRRVVRNSDLFEREKGGHRPHPVLGADAAEAE